MFRKRGRAAALVIVLVIAAAAAAFYWWVLPGLSSARSEPPAAEVAVATWLLHQSVPEDQRARKNPLGPDGAARARHSRHERRRDLLSHPERHPEHGHARLVAPRP